MDGFTEETIPGAVSVSFAFFVLHFDDSGVPNLVQTGFGSYAQLHSVGVR
jgi:hypothetical protein